MRFGSKDADRKKKKASKQKSKQTPTDDLDFTPRSGKFNKPKRGGKQ